MFLYITLAGVQTLTISYLVAALVSDMYLYIAVSTSLIFTTIASMSPFTKDTLIVN